MLSRIVTAAPLLRADNLTRFHATDQLKANRCRRIHYHNYVAPQGVPQLSELSKEPPDIRGIG